MFTGIVKDVGTVTSVLPAGKGLCVKIRNNRTAKQLSIGSSVAVNGACLTVTKKKQDTFVVEIMPETCAVTTLNSLQPKTRVNLEPAMRLSDRLDGHLVQGHVDTTARVTEMLQSGNDIIITFELPKASSCIIPKGSVAIDGISLTVVRPRRKLFSVCIIPHTWHHTNLRYIRTNDLVNIEFDFILKYLSQKIKAFA